MSTMHRFSYRIAALVVADRGPAESGEIFEIHPGE